MDEQKKTLFVVMSFLGTILVIVSWVNDPNMSNWAICYAGAGGAFALAFDSLFSMRKK